MLERVILTLLVVLLVSVFLVAGLVLIQLGSGHWLTSSYSFGASSGGKSLNFVADRNSDDDPSETGKLFRDDGVEIVRIKTTEEVSYSIDGQALKRTSDEVKPYHSKHNLI